MFESIPATFSQAMAVECVTESAEAYHSADISVGTTQVNVRQLEEAGGAASGIVIAFRGTDCLRDWVKDGEAWRECLRIGPTTAKTAEVHHGFYRAYLDVREQVADRVSSLMIGAARNPNDAQPTLPIYVTGHSLGAALALLCALDLDSRGFVIGGVYTFGGPRVGDVAWQELYNSCLKEKTFRFVNELDAVPRLPGLLLGYHHVGHDIFFPALGGVKFDPSIMARLVSDEVDMMKDYLARRVSCFTDHPIHEYVPKVLNAFGEPQGSPLGAAGLHAEETGI